MNQRHRKKRWPSNSQNNKNFKTAIKWASLRSIPHTIRYAVVVSSRNTSKQASISNHQQLLPRSCLLSFKPHANLSCKWGEGRSPVRGKRRRRRRGRRTEKRARKGGGKHSDQRDGGKSWHFTGDRPEMDTSGTGEKQDGSERRKD